MSTVYAWSGAQRESYTLPRAHYVSKVEDGHKGAFALYPTAKAELVGADGQNIGARIVYTGKGKTPDGTALVLRVTHTVHGASPNVTLVAESSLDVQEIDEKAWAGLYGLRPVLIWAGHEDNGKVLSADGGRSEEGKVALSFTQKHSGKGASYEFRDATCTTTGRLVAGDVSDGLAVDEVNVDMRELLAVKPPAVTPAVNGKNRVAQVA